VSDFVIDNSKIEYCYIGIELSRDLNYAQISNNVLSRNQRAGLRLFNNSYDNYITNNVIDKNDFYGIETNITTRGAVNTFINNKICDSLRYDIFGSADEISLESENNACNLTSPQTRSEYCDRECE
jgi:hypothetical protein